MRASPPFAIALHHFGWWRGAVALLASLALATVAAWAIAIADQQQSPWLVAAVAAAALLAVGAALVAGWAMSAPSRLRWDGQHWHLLRKGARDDEPWTGDVHVALDLGAWMLLRFRGRAPDGGAARALWLPVQRQGLEADWHGLRCAVFAHRRRDAAS